VSEVWPQTPQCHTLSCTSSLFEPVGVFVIGFGFSFRCVSLEVLQLLIAGDKPGVQALLSKKMLSSQV